ncbi:hypothetical protein ACHAW6_009901 [Cyclotella cf. meneghiniana]
MRITDLAFVATILLAAHIPSTQAGKKDDKSNDKGKNQKNNKNVRAPATKQKNTPDENVNDLFKSLKNNPNVKAGNRNANNNSKPTNKMTNNSKPNSRPSSKSDDDYTYDDYTTPMPTEIPTNMPTTYMPTTYMPTTYIPTYIPTYMPTYYWYDDIVNGNTWGNVGDSTSTWWGSSVGKAGKSTTSTAWWGSSGGKAGKSGDTVGAWWGAGMMIGGKGRKMKETSEAQIKKVSQDQLKTNSGKRKRHLQAGKSDKDGFRANFDNGGKANKDNDDAAGGDDIVFYAYELLTSVPTPLPSTLDMVNNQNSAPRTRSFPIAEVSGKSNKEDMPPIVRGEHRGRNRDQSTQRPTYIPTYYPTYMGSESESSVSGNTPIPTYIPTYYPTEYLPKAEKPSGWTMPREWLRGDEAESDSNASGGKSSKRKLKLLNGRGRKRTR